MKKTFQRFLLAAIVLAAGMAVASCSKEKDGPRPPEPPKVAPFIQKFWDGYFLYMSFFNENGCDLGFGRSDQLPGIMYSPTSNAEEYNHLLQKYHDTGTIKKLTSYEKSYIPHAYGMTHIGCTLIRDYGEGKGGKVETDVSNTENIRIRFKTYAQFIANGYKWGNGVDSEWQDMTFKEFNSKAPHYLVDVTRVSIICGKVGDMEASPEYTRTIKLFFTFESNVVTEYYYILNYGDPGA